MRVFIFLILFLSIAVEARLESACFPDPNDAEMMAELRAELGDVGDMSSWPIGAIYLHGWDDILQNGSSDELSNRERMKELAKELARNGLRIALPVSGVTRRLDDGRTVLRWPYESSMPLAESPGSDRASSIEGLARIACSADGTGDDVELAHPRMLIGYSNGAYRAINAAETLGCNSAGYIAEHYSRVIAIGARESSSCANLRTSALHTTDNFNRRVGEFSRGWDEQAVWRSVRPLPRGTGQIQEP